MSGVAPWSMTYKASVSREARAADRAENLPQWPRKSEVPCCAATRDDLGRLCVGFCGPACRRRPARSAA